MDNKIQHPKLNKENWTILRRCQFSLLRDFLDNQADGSLVLDIGSGPSPFRELYARFNLTSVDWKKQEMVDMVLNLDENLPFERERFDIVTSTNTFEHLYTDTALAEAQRVLKRGGWLVGSVPFLVAIHQAPHDYYRFTGFALKRKLLDAGFKDIEVKEIGTAYDVVWHNTRQLFMSAFDQHWFIAKISWNMLKIYQFFFGRFLSSVENKNMCLGYMFYAQK